MRLIRFLIPALCLAAIAQASIITYTGTLSGASEVPPVATAGTGSVFVTVDNVANTITLSVTFSGLSTVDAAAHIHCCAAPGTNTAVATAAPALPGFPLNVTSGTFLNQSFSLLDPNFYLGSFVTNNGGTAASAEAVLLAGLANGQAYFNIHTQQNPGGEVRALLVATPEPATFAFVGLALAGLFARRCLHRM